ncbi:PREDICTED: relaxin receptor 1 isoform X2 [Vollenhovia emeryi]|uniref:relaxin receptor 1 isoform X2 n=1 Tax=Vollenhovia emeryi TaxID=411798 RepID=UPI0005F54510|nr:PREDICTED: relaxin receptor 1 isoform X2 [Vollenhovia emeryi]
MKYKHIVIVGASLIATLCLLSGLMYYFNQDKCPIGTFLCLNSTTCMPQRSWCNGVPDCPHSDDESTENCYLVVPVLDFRHVDMHGNWDWFMRDRDWGNSKNCDTFDAPAECTYYACRATCTNYTTVPKNLSSNVTAIFLTDNSLTHLSRDALSRYPEIRLLYLDNNDIVKLEKGVFLHQSRLFWLILTNNSLSEILPGHLTGLNKLETLLLDQNKITTADFSDLENSTAAYLINLSKNMLTTSALKLPRLPALTEIILDENHFESITEDLFAGCPALKSLSMEDNSVSNIGENAFRNLQQLVELNLAYNRIVTIPSNVFQPVNNLSKLLIGYNPVVELSMTHFNPLNNLRSLNIEDINMDNMDKNAFDAFPRLEFVYFKKFHYCMTYAPKVQKCRPISDGVSSMSHLLDKPLLRAAVWSISCVTCLGNSLVLWGRFTAKDENRVLSIIIRNLAVSDMLMGIYLFIIAVEDARFRDSYKEEASTWMSSWSCTLLGALAMTSSEVSVLILSFMSVERFVLIAAPLKCHRAMTSQAASSSMIVIWIVGLVIALVPVIHWRSSTRFYGVNGMCFPLHIDDPYLIGWEYSAFIFLGLNLIGLMIIGYVYIAMFASIWRTRRATPLSVGDSEFALRFFLIVLTDAACWAPIIALKILAMMKYPVPPDLHAWIVIFILPVNSAVNPLLYTFTTPKFRERLNEGWFGKVRSCISGKHSRQDSQASATTNETMITDRNMIQPIWNEYDDDRGRTPPLLNFNDKNARFNGQD